MASSEYTGWLSVTRVLIIEGLANLIMFVAKLTVGIYTGSAAILADSMHSLTDLANNVVVLVAARISTHPPDDDHPYGHRKFETLAIFGLATLLTVIAIELALHAIQRAGEPIEQSRWGMIIMGGVLLVNLSIAGWENYCAGKLKSDLIKADARHTLGDVLTTLSVIVGWQLAVFGFPWMDAVFALVVAGVVFYLAWDLFRMAIPKLVDEAATDPDKITQAIESITHVKEVRRVRSRSMGRHIYADVIVAVDGDLRTSESHLIADAIEEKLADTLGIRDVTVQIVPINVHLPSAADESAVEELDSDLL